MRTLVVVSAAALLLRSGAAVGTGRAATMRSEAMMAAQAAAAEPAMPEEDMDKSEGATIEADHDPNPIGEKELERIMGEVDTDQDGKASWEEVLAHAKAERSSEIQALHTKGQVSLAEDLAWDSESETRLKTSFEKSDADKDGFLTLSEMVTMAQEEDVEEPEEKDEHDEDHEDDEHEGAAKEGFEASDGGEDQESAQVASFLEQAESEVDDYYIDQHQDQNEPDAETSAKELEEFIQVADKDKDGKLSFEEVKNAFSAPDLLEDGKGMEDEFKGADTNNDGFLDASELDKLRKDAMGIDESDRQGH